MGKTPIAHKYCEGKVKRTLKKEWKEHEIVMRGTWFDLFRSHWEIFDYGETCGSFIKQPMTSIMVYKRGKGLDIVNEE